MSRSRSGPADAGRARNGGEVGFLTAYGLLIGGVAVDSLEAAVISGGEVAA